MTDREYDRLGISVRSPTLASVFINTVLPALRSNISPESKEMLETWDTSALMRNLRKLQLQVNKQVCFIGHTPVLTFYDFFMTIQNEAASRLIIDQWLLTLMDMCAEMEISLLLFPEFRLSQSNETPAQIIHKQNVTFITGVADYGILTVPSLDFGRYEECKS